MYVCMSIKVNICVCLFVCDCCIPVCMCVCVCVCVWQGPLDEEYLFEFADETFVKHMAVSEVFPEA